MMGYFLIISQFIIGAGFYQLFSNDKKVTAPHLLFAYPLGAYLFTQTIFFIGIAGLPLTSISYFVVSVLLVTGVAVAIYYKHKAWAYNLLSFNKIFRSNNVKSGFIRYLPHILISTVAVFFGSMCLFYTRYTSDSYLYYLGKGLIISIDKGLNIENFAGVTGLETNPLFLPIQYASFLATDFPHLESIFGIYYVLSVLTIFFAVRHFSKPKNESKNIVVSWIAFACAFIFATVPMVISISQTALANLCYTFYVFMAFVLLLDGIRQKNTGLIYLSAIAYAGAVWLYSFALPHYIAIILILIVWALSTDRKKILFTSFFITIVLSLPWPIWRILHWEHLESSFFQQWIFKIPETLEQKMLPYGDVIWLVFYSICFLAIRLLWTHLKASYAAVGLLKDFFVTFYIHIGFMILIAALYLSASGQIRMMGHWFTEAVRLMSWTDSWGIIFGAVILSVLLFKRNSWGGIFLGVSIILLLMNITVGTFVAAITHYNLPAKLTNIFYGYNRVLLSISLFVIVGFGILANDFIIATKNSSFKKTFLSVIIAGFVIIHLFIAPPIPSKNPFIRSAVALMKQPVIGNHEYFIRSNLREPLYQIKEWMIKYTDKDSQLVLPGIAKRMNRLLGNYAFAFIRPMIYPRRIVFEDFDPVVLDTGGSTVKGLVGPDKYSKGYRLYYDLKGNLYFVGKENVGKVQIAVKNQMPTSLGQLRQ